jgi:transposase
MERPIMNDLSRSRTVLEQDSTLIAVVELSLSSGVVAGIVPGLDRHPLKKLCADHDALLQEETLTEIKSRRDINHSLVPHTERGNQALVGGAGQPGVARNRSSIA